MTGTAETLRAKILHFCQESSGGVMIYVGIMLPILMGIASLAVDVGLWYANKRVVQSVADAAALGGALEVRRKGDLSTLQLAATEYATENGYNGTDDTIDINSPPESGPLIGVATAVEVIVERPAPSFLSSLVNKGQTTIAARAVASYGTAEACIWALNPTASGAVTVSGNAQVNMNCGIMANSSSPSAITQNGASCINAASVASVGGASGGCINPPPVTTSYAADPMSYVSGPSWSGCDHPNQIKANNNQTVNLAPGVYCNKITAQNGGRINFASGLYVLDGAALTIHGEANGTDVQFYLTENTAQNDNITINAGSTVQLSAPDFESDLPAGVLFYQDRNSTAGINHTMNGQTDMLLEGILYLPNADVNFSGGGAADPTATVIIADEISFTGNSEFGNYILSPTASNPQLVTVTLVE
jgi:hypothetical protein